MRSFSVTVVVLLFLCDRVASVKATNIRMRNRSEMSCPPDKYDVEYRRCTKKKMNPKFPLRSVAIHFTIPNGNITYLSAVVIEDTSLYNLPGFKPVKLGFTKE